jgi:inosose dehydratase
MNVTISSAPDNWGVWFPADAKQTPWNRYLDELVEAGYFWTELGPYGYLPTDMKVLRSELDKRRVKVTGTFIMPHLEDKDAWPAIEKDLLAIGERLAALSAPFLIIIDDVYTNLFTGEHQRPAKLDKSGWKQLVENTQRIAQVAKERFGLRSVYHPHTETHVEYEDQIERLLEETDPDLISICLDTGHHAYRHGDPVAFMRKHHKRIPYLHLKSVDPDKRDKVTREKIPFALAVAQDMFCEPSQGAVDFPAFRDVLREVDYQGWGIVEQDMYPAPFDKPLPIAKRTREYLRKIGIG